MRIRLMQRALLGTAVTVLAAGAVMAASGTASAAPAGNRSAGYSDSGHHYGNDRDCRYQSSPFYGGDYGGGLLSWIL